MNEYCGARVIETLARIQPVYQDSQSPKAKVLNINEKCALFGLSSRIQLPNIQKYSKYSNNTHNRKFGQRNI